MAYSKEEMQGLMDQMRVNFIKIVLILQFKEGILSRSDMKLFEKGGLSLTSSMSNISMISDSSFSNTSKKRRKKNFNNAGLQSRCNELELENKSLKS